MKAFLGISAFYHDSAAAIVVDGEIVAAAHEERFTRIKHDESFPSNAVTFVLAEAGLSISDLDAIVFYDKPLLKFERLLETYHSFAPKGFRSFVTSMPVWIKDKLSTRGLIWKEIEKISGELSKKNRPPLLFTEHHLSHGASAFYPSPFKNAAILTVDGVGEYATSIIAHGTGNKIKVLKEQSFPHSLGLLYSAFTYYCGFKVNSGEYKLMGLAPYGEHGGKKVAEFKDKILNNIVSLKDDGSISLNMDYFDFATGLKMCRDEKWKILLGIPKRESESNLTQEYMDLALAIQEITEESVVRLAKTAKKITGEKFLVMAGGVALNCVANSKILDNKIFDKVWVQPASGDAGGALGSALAGYYIWANQERVLNNLDEDQMKGSLLGPEYCEADILRMTRKFGAKFEKFDEFEKLSTTTARLISEGKVVGWFQGKMEWGPRALGARSILGDARDPQMQKKLNVKIKYREGFRPFAPAVLEEDAHEYFKMSQLSPYMLFTFPVIEKRRKPLLPIDKDLFERLYSPRSDVPVITHLDYSARVQTINKKFNSKFHQLLSDYKTITDYSLFANTSFNVRGEPIVCSPEDAYRCFMNTEMDYLVVGNFLLDKNKQNKWEKDDTISVKLD